MKRTLLASAICILLGALTVYGQNTTKKTRQQLLSENIELRRTVDSLLTVIENLNLEFEAEDSLVTEYMIPFDSTEPETAAYEYDVDAADSLIDAWYRNQANVYADAQYNMDSVQFSSAVSDSVMMERLKAINSYITLPFNETVKNYIILYSEKNRKMMSEILGLSNYYMPIFEETFARYGLPLELKYMAIIESRLNPRAVSRAGACGLWQFMYRTARQYGLEISSFIDERQDIEKSADAAARYLADAYKIFGDWPLAISSYNCGAGNVQKAIRRAGGSTNFWDIYAFLPRETRGYMPAFVGAMYAMNYYKEYGIVPADMGIPAVVDTFHIHRNLHFKQINGVVGIPEETLRQINPQYTHDVIPGTGGDYVLNIPINWSAAFMSVEPDSLYNFHADSLLNPQIIRDIAAKNAGGESRVIYRVKNGDYLGRIASRYHVSVKQIMTWNHLRNSNLRIGQVLYIYTRSGGPKTTSASTSSASAKSTPTTASEAPSSTFNPDEFDGYTTYTVKSGDTLYSIAKDYSGVSAQNIMDYNKIGSNIHEGMTIRIPTPKSR